MLYQGGSGGGSRLRAIVLALLVLVPVVVASPVPPNASILDPEQGAVLSGLVTASGSVVNPEQTTGVYFRVDAGSWMQTSWRGCPPDDYGGTYCTPPSTWSFDLDTTRYADGTHDLAVKASYAGGSSIPKPVTVTFRNGADIAITSPAAGATVAGTVAVAGTAVPVAAPVAGVKVSFAGGPEVAAALAADGTWTASLPTTRVPNGAATIVAKATTTVGVVTSTSVPVTVANPETRDLRIGGVSASAPTVETDSQTAIRVRLVNDGNMPTPASTTRIEYHDGEAWRFLSTVRSAVPAFAYVDQIVTWRPPADAVGSFTVRATADVLQEVAETSEANNSGTGQAGARTALVQGVVAGNVLP